MVKLKKKQKKRKTKFCPVCGAELEATDTYCTNCGYSFEARHKKHKKGIKWKNIILLLIILLGIYIGFRYIAGKPIIPTSLGEILNFTNVTK